MNGNERELGEIGIPRFVLCPSAGPESMSYGGAGVKQELEGAQQGQAENLDIVRILNSQELK